MPGPWAELADADLAALGVEPHAHAGVGLLFELRVLEGSQSTYTDEQIGHWPTPLVSITTETITEEAIIDHSLWTGRAR